MLSAGGRSLKIVRTIQLTMCPAFTARLDVLLMRDLRRGSSLWEGGTENRGVLISLGPEPSSLAFVCVLISWVSLESDPVIYRLDSQQFSFYFLSTDHCSPSKADSFGDGCSRSWERCYHV